MGWGTCRSDSKTEGRSIRESQRSGQTLPAGTGNHWTVLTTSSLNDAPRNHASAPEEGPTPDKVVIDAQTQIASHVHDRCR